MNEKRTQPTGEMSPEERRWHRLGEELGQVVAEELAKRDRRLAKLESAVRAIKRNARAGHSRSTP